MTIPVSEIPDLKPDSSEGIQLYVQVYDALYSVIRKEEIRKGSRFPSEKDLAEHFHVSRGTVRQALRYLEEDGLVSKEQGRGNLILAREKKQEPGFEEYSDVCRRFCVKEITEIKVSWQYRGLGQWLSEQLHLAKGAIAISAEILYYSSSEIIAVSQRIVPAKTLQTYGIDPEDHEQMRTFLLDQVIEYSERAVTELTMTNERAVSTDSQKEISFKYPFLSSVDITYDEQGIPLANIKNYLRCDCYHFQLNRSRRHREHG